MTTQYDTLIIGTGTAGYTAAYLLAEAGQKVAVADRRPYGGTCALRGCQPKKYLVAGAEAVERAEALVGRGIVSAPRLDWAALQRAKQRFTDPVPEDTRDGFAAAGIATLSGEAVFVAPDTIRVGEDLYTAEHFIIATGATPVTLNFPGVDLLLTSDAFLDQPQLPEKLLFVGGGYISFEFAHVAARAGAAVTILHRGQHPLGQFDNGMVQELLAASEEAGVRVILEAQSIQIETSGDDRLVSWETPKGPETSFVDAVFHGAGRQADIAGLDPQAGGISFTGGGITVADTLQSISNPRVYAVGDAADIAPKLAPVADREAEIAVGNILSGKSIRLDATVVPSVVFTLPPLASVGLTEAAARQGGLEVEVNQGSAARWPSSRRIGQTRACYKVVLDSHSKTLLGAHLLGHNAGEMINIFALAMQQHLTAAQLKQMLWAYPTNISDIKYML